MTTKYALQVLRDGVKDYMDAAVTAAGGTPPPHVFGWRKRTDRSGTFRIVWKPGNDANELGELGPAQQPGREPRPLATLDELFTVYLEARDPSAPSDEEKQWVAARALYDLWYAGVYNTLPGNVTILDQSFEGETLVSKSGATIRVLGSVQAMIPDGANAVIFGPAFENTSSELDSGDEVDEISPRSARVATTGDHPLEDLDDVDGTTIADGDVVLAWQQTDAAENGRYVAHDGPWELITDTLAVDDVVRVLTGTTAGPADYRVTETSPLTFDRVSP